MELMRELDIFGVSATDTPSPSLQAERFLKAEQEWWRGSSGTISARVAVIFQEQPLLPMSNLVIVSREVLSKYEVKDDGKIREIREALTKAKSVEAERGVLYEIDDGVFVGVDREGRLRIYLA